MKKALVIYNHPAFTLLTAAILSLMLVGLFINYPLCFYSVDFTVRLVYSLVAVIFFIKELVKVINIYKK